MEKLSESDYESICRETCAIQVFAAPNERLEDVYWWHLSRRVHQFLDVPFSFREVEYGPRAEVHQASLDELLRDRQTHPFDFVAIGQRYIQEALDRICKLHQTMMKMMRVPIRYGLPTPDDYLSQAQRQLFPNARSYVLGGCNVDLERTETESLVCERCRQAERAWQKQQDERPN